MDLTNESVSAKVGAACKARAGEYADDYNPPTLDAFLDGAAFGRELGKLEGRIAALEFADVYTDGAYAGIKAELNILRTQLALLSGAPGEAGD